MFIKEFKYIKILVISIYRYKDCIAQIFTLNTFYKIVRLKFIVLQTSSINIVPQSLKIYIYHKILVCFLNIFYLV